MDVLAVDIGATKVEAAVVGDDGAVEARHRAPTRPHPSAALAEAAGAALAGARELGRVPVAVGVGCAGPMAAGGERVSPVNVPEWRDHPLRAEVASLTGLPVFVDNDAKALARGEGWLGAAAGERDYLAMVVSTGIGAGIVVDGRLLQGVDGNAGHLGHLVVVPGGRPCGCGGRGCLEAEASGSAIAARTGAPPAAAPPSERERAGRLVGRALAAACTLLDVRLVVVGGSVALGYGEALLGAARQELAEVARLPFTREVRVVPAGLGGDGPLVGAAALARARLAEAVDRPTGG